MTCHRLFAPSAAALLVILSGGNAFAQTIAASGQPYPNRIVHGTNLGFSTRPQNLNPLGISNEDCVQDTTLQFSVTLSGFTGTDSVEVWGSLGSDCTAMTDRGIGATSARCWGLRAGNITSPIINTPQTYTLNVRVQDLVGWQQAAPDVTENANPPAKGLDACNAQPTPGVVPMNINFLAVDASGNVDGTPYQYAIATDIKAPPGPAGVSVSTTGADWLVSWTPNADKVTVGYNIFFGSTPSAPDGGQADCSTVSLTRQGTDDPTVSGAAVGSYDLGPAKSDTQAGVIVWAVDAFGNMHEGTSPICDTVGTVEADAPGVSCAVAGPGATGGATIACLGLLAAVGCLRRGSRDRALSHRAPARRVGVRRTRSA
jgi:hypothetical protein